VADDASLAAWLRLTLIHGVGGETQRTLLKAFGLPEAIFASGMGALRGVVGTELAERLLHGVVSESVIEAALRWAEEPGNRILTLADSDYPQALLRCADPPVLLYVKGRVELLNRPALAVVGSRNATPQGEANADAFAKSLCSAGLTIVSGLALGIDTAAHRGALGALGADFADAQAGSTSASSRSTRQRSPAISRGATGSSPGSPRAVWWSKRRRAAAR
jgi:DNA processing protein